MSRPTLLKVLLFAVAAALVALAWYLDLLAYLTLENIERYQQQLGWWFPLIFVMSFVIGELLQVPSVLWIFFAGMIWPWWFGLPMALAGALAAATVSFLVARYFLGKGFTERLPPTVVDMNEKLKQAPITAVIIVRLTTFLHPAMHWVLAASSVKPPAFLIGTLIGITPVTIAIVMLGEVFLNWWDDYSQYIVGTVIAITIAYIVLLRMQRTSRRD